jgi:hypothetical protein
MILTAAAVTSLLAFLQGTAAIAPDVSTATTNQHYSDELIAAMVKTAKEHQATVATVATGIYNLSPPLPVIRYLISHVLIQQHQNFVLLPKLLLV